MGHFTFGCCKMVSEQASRRCRALRWRGIRNRMPTSPQTNRYYEWPALLMVDGMSPLAESLCHAGITRSSDVSVGSSRVMFTIIYVVVVASREAASGFTLFVHGGGHGMLSPLRLSGTMLIVYIRRCRGNGYRLRALTDATLRRRNSVNNKDIIGCHTATAIGYITVVNRLPYIYEYMLEMRHYR